ncbi:guard cell S-type anion channel SLAC1 isoform X2 [Andrographis paniculata]|uniref:guard cell S-type anion channel SLAC1 isoform X2 n=1 Tax=Andrographis paniculata TaxID=175694 RepID=UPI0021E76006|nr:guard cell S-type anion channel SLAC1 isoform X2 [Andrographis paniculata]
MEMREISKRPSTAHYVDIHQALEEDEEEEQQQQQQQEKIETNKNTKMAENKEKRSANNKPIKPRDSKRPNNNRSFSRQVSLETGFSALNGEKSTERKALPRSGKSFGGFGTMHRYNAGAMTERKGDFDIFRTKSGLVRQNSKLPSRRDSGMLDFEQNNADGNVAGGAPSEGVNKSVPAGRYFAALKGPELDEIKESEDILLPKDEKWPFLLRFPIGCFGMCLGLSSQAILWRALATSPSMEFLHITPLINLVIWTLALSALAAVFAAYTLKCVFYFEAVKREYFHPVRVNFFFAPWVVGMFLSIGVPPCMDSERMHPAVWCVFMAPVVFLDLKIYGQWLSGGKRRLSKVANPSSHLSVVGNFVGAILAAKVGWGEAGKFLWAIGFAHYLVVFVTLYQRLPTSEALPKELHPVYSMFIATPAAASIAWGAVYGEFDGLARTCFFIALFLYCSLVVRINFFRGFKFSIAWWSYTFPMTTASIATIKYAEQSES